ncbi:MAG: response regulator [Kofleriaceae bacterium]
MRSKWARLVQRAAPMQHDGAGRYSRRILPAQALLAIAAALIAAFVIAALSWHSLIVRSEAARWVDHTDKVKNQIASVMASVTDAETGQRGFLLTRAERYLEPYNSARTRVPTQLLALKQLTADNPNQQQRIAKLSPLVDQKLSELADTITHERASDHEGALEIVRTDRGKDLMDQVRSLAQAMEDEEQRLLVTRTADWEASVATSTYIVFGGVALLVVMTLLIGFLASRDYRAVTDEGWVRGVQSELAGEMQGDIRLESLGENVLRVLTRRFAAPTGVMYVVENGQLRPIAKAAVLKFTDLGTRRFGDGIIGDVAQRDTTVHIDKLPEGYLEIGSALGETKPKSLAITPAVVEGKVVAVTELAFLKKLDPIEKQALDRVSESIAIAIRSAQDRSRLEELLEETQRQGEELQAQQEELRVSNEELEQQSNALQLSQTQLENQAAELEQINRQLELQARSLESQRDDLTRTASELQRSSEYKSQFLANMSHELRTPLNSSLILAKLLADNRDQNLTAEQIKFAETIYTAGNDLLTLINDILDLSKIEAGMLDVRTEPVHVQRFVDEIRKVFQPVANQKKIELQFSVEKGTAESIETDPTRLSQIVRNLMSNALKFTEAGGVSLHVVSIGDQIEFRVKDTGIGIEPNQHEVIFQAFRQADGTSSRKFGGTGLGLSISRDLARLLGGDLVVSSATGKGSTFTLSIPRGRAAATATPQPMALHRASRSVTNDRILTSQSGSGAPFTDDRMHISHTSRSLLVIEDDIAFARVLFDLAHELEFKVLVAPNAEIGLDLARQYLPSAIILDVGLPDRSGLAVLDALKRDTRTRHIPVHMASVDDFAHTAFQMGAAGYVLKPVEREKLIDAIKRLEEKFTQKLRRVLVVEDDPLLLESTARLLSADGVEVVTAGTTEDGLEKLTMLTFDCMVLDLSLPDRSGIEMLEEMSRDGKHSFPPMIVYTGRLLKTDEVRELEKFSQSIIIKGARSPERLLDEVTLFLHQVESRLPPERQRMLRDARDRESVFEGRKVLLAEDDVRNIFALTSVLEPKGVQLIIARNGNEAISAAHQHPDLDLVLMDVMMPELDGLQAMRALRLEPRFAKLPIIALTAKAMQDDRDQCIAAGANDYIAKPLDVDKLLSLARVWIRK